MGIRNIINYLYERPLLTAAITIGVPAVVGAVAGHYRLEDTTYNIQFLPFSSPSDVHRETMGIVFGMYTGFLAVLGSMLIKDLLGKYIKPIRK